MPPLQVRFFGRFELLYDEKLVHLGRNFKALAILKYLLAHQARPVSRDYLMDWLWPESGIKKARWSLNTAICDLRKLLSGAGVPAASLDYIVLEEGYYSLSKSLRTSSDRDEFDARYNSGLRLQKAGRMQEAVGEYEKAIELYRDDFLVDELYQDWTLIERERLVGVYIDILNRLASYYAETERYRESIQTSYWLLEKDRCHEDSYRLLMKCYAHLGSRSRALHQYRLCKQIFRQVYGVAPSPTIELYYRSLLGDQR